MESMILSTDGNKQPLCKECKRIPRAPGSSRCEYCSTAYKAQRLESDALQRKIDKQNGKRN